MSTKKRKKIYEDYFNVKIKKGNWIHHIDWDGANDDPNNLIDITTKQHGWLTRVKNYNLKSKSRDEIYKILKKRLIEQD